MNTNERQPSGRNPEWELNKEQNITIAKRIEKLLGEKPLVSVEFEEWLRDKRASMEEMQNVEEVEIIDEYLQTGEVRRDRQDILHLNEMRDLIFIDELTVGFTTVLEHIDSKHRRIFLGVGHSEEASRGTWAMMRGFIDLLPEGYKYPVYIIREVMHNEYDNSPEFDITTIDGKFPNKILGDDGLLYYLHNTFCFNLLGQGLKIEEIVRGGTLDQEYDGECLELAKQKLKRVDFVPREEDSRVMPLDGEDYRKIDKMFEQINAGLYRYR